MPVVAVWAFIAKYHVFDRTLDQHCKICHYCKKSVPGHRFAQWFLKCRSRRIDSRGTKQSNSYICIFQRTKVKYNHMYVSVESNMCFNSTHFLSFERSLYIYPHSFTVQYWTVLYCTVLRRTVLCTTVPGRTRSCSGRRSCPRRSRRSSTARTPGCTSCSLKNINSIKKTAKRGLVWLTL